MPSVCPLLTWIREFACRFEQEHIDMYLKPATAAKYRSTLRLYILPALGDRRLEAVLADAEHIPSGQNGHIGREAIWAVRLLPPADDPDLPAPSRSPTSESASLEHAPADSAAPLPMEDERTVLSRLGLGGRTRQGAR